MKNWCLLILISLIQIPAFAQELKDIRSDKNDLSIQKGNLLHRLLEQNDSMRLADSIEKIMLERQISQLLSFEVRKRIELEEQMQNIKREDSVKRAMFTAELDSLRKNIRGYPVIPFSDTLFLIYSRVGSVNASMRAGLLSANLKAVYRNYNIQPDSIRVVTDGDMLDIVHQDKILISVTRDDALWNNLSQDSLAKRYREILVSSIKSYRESVSFKSIMTAIILSGVVLVCYLILLRLIVLLFRRMDKNLIPRISIPRKWQIFSNYETTQKEKQTRLLQLISKFIRLILILLLTLIMLVMIANILPQTKHVGNIILGYILSPLRSIGQAVIGYIPNLIKIVIIIIIFWVVIRFFRYLSRELAKGDLRIPGFYTEWARPTFMIIRFILLVLMVVFIFPFLPGSSSVVFQGISVFIGLVISISSSSIIGNLIAGLVLTYMRSFRIGDTIKAGENAGIVVEKTAFVTRIRTYKGEYITIPHSNILSAHVTNYSASARDGKLILYTTITIGYDVPWKKVHEMMINAALDTGHILKDPAPFVLQTSLNDFHVSYQLNAYTKKPEVQPRIYSELHQNIQNRFREAGVEILSPMYNAVREGNKPEF